MKELKIKAPNTILHDKQLKLYDFIEDFVEIELYLYYSGMCTFKTSNCVHSA